MNKKVIYAALMFVLTMSSGNASAQQFPYQNPALSAHERAVDLCGRLTLEAVFLVVCHDCLWSGTTGRGETCLCNGFDKHGRCNRFSGTYRNGSFV